MTNRIKSRICAALAWVLVCALVLTGCSSTVSASADLMSGISPRAVSGKSADDAFITAQTAFALSLLQGCIASDANENVLLSPLSVQMALAMTANGARGETLTEMETALGGLPIDTLNEYLYTTRTALSDDWHLANSIWFKSAVDQGFLQTNADYYGADAFQSAFDDQTVNDINNWVNTHTDGMIEKAIDRIDKSSMMYLINALVFDAAWATPYANSELYTGSFTTEAGDRSAVNMMISRETTYLNDGRATGFVKPYAGGQYAFVALLPNAGISLAEYIHGLDAAALCKMLSTDRQEIVIAHLPQFEIEYGATLNGVLADMGMPTAFTDRADFSGMGRDDLCIGDVMHKTHITVDEHGTKAGAVTSVEIKTMSAGPENVVVLNRPFVYMIVDTQTNVPAFVGTVTDISI